jgi:hypothetical protein
MVANGSGLAMWRHLKNVSPVLLLIKGTKDQYIFFCWDMFVKPGRKLISEQKLRIYS